MSDTNVNDDQSTNEEDKLSIMYRKIQEYKWKKTWEENRKDIFFILSYKYRFLEIFKNLKWNKDMIRGVLYGGNKDLFRQIKSYKSQEKIDIGSGKKENIWKKVESSKDLSLLSRYKGIDWSDKKAKIFKLARETSRIDVLFQIDGINITSNRDDFQFFLENIVRIDEYMIYNNICQILEKNNPMYLGDLQNFIHTVFPSFDDKMIVNLNDGMKSDEAKDKLTKNKNLTLQLIESFNNVGILDDLLKAENVNIEEINKVLSETGKEIHKIDYKQLLDYINNLNVEKPKEALELLVIERHLLNKWAHNIESYVQADIMCNLPDQTIISKRHAQILDQYSRVISSINNGDIASAISGKNIDFDAVKGILKVSGVDYVDRTMADLEKDLIEVSSLERRKTKLRAYVGETLWCRRKNNPPPTAQSLCDKYFSDFKSLRENYYEAVKSCNGKNRVSTYSFSQIIEKFLKDPVAFQNILEAINNTNSKNDGNSNNNANNNNNDKLILNLIEIQKFFKKASLYLDNSTINELFTRSAEYLDLTDDCYNTKQAITSTIITTVKELKMEENNICCMRLSTGGEGKKDALDIFLDGHIQVYGGHFEENSDTSNNPHFNNIKYFKEPAEINMEEILKRSDPFIKTFIPIGRVSDEIREEFRLLEQAIRKIEGMNVQVDNVPEEKLREIKLREIKLGEIKGNNPDKYEALKIKILLGAGLDRFMAYYNERTKVTEQASISGTNTEPENSSGQIVDVDRVKSNIMKSPKFLEFAKELKDAGEITLDEYNALVADFNGNRETPISMRDITGVALKNNAINQYDTERVKEDENNLLKEQGGKIHG